MAGNDVTLSRLRRLVEPDSGSSSNVVSETEWLVEVSSPIREEILLPPPSPKRRRSVTEGLVDPKRPQTSEGGSKDVCPMDHSFDALSFIEANLLGLWAQEVLWDCDPIESVRWAEWAVRPC
ncbi:hypothetical protein PIB30_090237 [Stylosanthes scabra]|uniref:Uncharacterized protein n=1 Tax=Stylosanthes scabra TaxID=79078 RepID=A0ABU6UTN0_9FABA|nr:hypothetical protein [Stylosanthes scabra]